MGASTSTEDNGEGLTLEGLIEEANRVLVRATEVITQTVESEVGDMVSDLQERAAAKVNNFTRICIFANRRVSRTSKDRGRRRKIRKIEKRK